MRRIVHFITAARTSWIVLLGAALIAAALFAAGSGNKSEAAPAVGLPASADSAIADARLDGFPKSDSTVGLIVFDRDGDELTDADVDAVTAAAANLADFTPDGFVPPPAISDDGTVALVTVPLEIEANLDTQAERAAELRASASEDLPGGLTARLTGPEGFEADIAAVFEGANVTLLLTTVIVVAILLIITYRSPWLWLVPLIVVGVADALAGIVAARVAALAGIALDASVTGILSVLVFGAGTNYALLLIARYRDELRLIENRREAMAKALSGAGPAVIASGSTVVLSLLTLVFAQLTGNRALGIACATGVVVAMIFALVVLPAALVLFGRGLFWPYVPRFGSENRAETGVWHRLATLVARRPVAIGLVGLVLLGGLALGVPQVKVGLSQTERFTAVPEAVVGQEILSEAFPAGSSSPAIVVVRSAALNEVVSAAEDVEGVVSATPGASDSTFTRVDVVLDAAAETPAAAVTIVAVRDAVQNVTGADAAVGGLDARSVDVDQAQRADQNLVIPLILLIVFLVLVVLLRSLVAPLLLLLTVVASFFASIGASWLLLTAVFGFPAFDTSVILFSFLFLVALGVDYNIFLVTRAREEAQLHGTRTGMIRAVSATGGVITSAGILLAAVFAVLGVLPLITLTQIGVVVCFGVLLDTLLVRTIVVPALAFICGEKFWWPSRVFSPALSAAGGEQHSARHAAEVDQRCHVFAVHPHADMDATGVAVASPRDADGGSARDSGALSEGAEHRLET